MQSNRQVNQLDTPLPDSALGGIAGSHSYSALIILLLSSILCVFSVSCNRGNSQPGRTAGKTATQSPVKVDTATQGKTMDELLHDFDLQTGKKRVSSANKILGILFRAELTDSLLTFTSQTQIDSMKLWVWYGAAEHYYDTQNYAEGLRYAKRALPLARRGHNLSIQGDCEHITSLLYFRLSDYARAVEHARKGLDIERQMGDKSRISSTLNTLAGICLVAKQWDDGEHYIKEAIRYSTELKDSNRLAIQYGMASELCHSMGKEQQALDYARLAYNMDSSRGNKAKVGIRLSQMAAAEMSLERYGDAEQHLRQAMLLLAKAGNETSLAICNNQMGELLNRRGAHTEAAQYFKQACSTFVRQKDLYNESRAQIGLYNALIDTSPRKAADHLRRYAFLKDSIYRRNTEQAISQYNVSYKTEELTRRQEHERVEKQGILVTGIILVTTLLVVVAALVFMNRARRRNHILLKQLSSLREDFFTNITHEFRTPLTLILGLSRELSEDPENSDTVKEKAQVIGRQGNNLLTLINQLLDISKVKSTVGNAHWRNGNITAYITMIIESYRDYANSRNIVLHFIPREAVVMDFVPDYMNKIMNNLLSNSLKFTPPSGRVGAAMWREGDRLLLDVSDTGRGMDKDTLSHIFEPFFQAETDTHNIGTGIGLALVKQIIDSLKGSISVESTPGKGTIFHISLPIHNNVRQKVDADATSSPTLPQTNEKLEDKEGNDNDCRILIIEDNLDVAAYMGSQLSSREHYAITYATNGREGLEKAQQLVPDLIITDLMMPEMDGLEVCRQVRANDIINHIPIIVVTAKNSEEERIKGLEAGADAYLIKPFNAEELRIRVAKLLDSRRMLRKKFASGMNKDKENDNEGTPLTDAEVRFLTKVTDIVYTQLNSNKATGVSLVASMMCMSNSQFYRKMVAVTGQTPVAYIQRVKIKKAMKLLDEDRKISFAEVADQCGFDVYPNFVRAFKNVCGMTPSEYRKRQEAVL